MSIGNTPTKSARLTDEQAKALARQLREQEETVENLDRRKAARVMLPEGYQMLGTFHHPGGSSQSLVLVVRDFSRGGMGFLHGGFMHPGTRCVLVLVGRDRSPVYRTNGSVMRCTHVRGPVHDVGVKFDTPAPVEMLVPALGATEATIAQTEITNLVTQLQKQLRDKASLEEMLRTVEVLAATIEGALADQRAQ